jgi:hypothetical protein
MLAGLIKRLTFHSPANGFCVLRIQARGHHDLVTVVGHAAEINPGEWISVSGEWVTDREHGLPFKASFPRTSARLGSVSFVPLAMAISTAPRCEICALVGFASSPLSASVEGSADA